VCCHLAKENERKYDNTPVEQFPMTSPVHVPSTQVNLQRSLVVRHPTIMTSSDDDEESRRCHIPGPRTGFAQPIAVPNKVLYTID